MVVTMPVCACATTCKINATQTVRPRPIGTVYAASVASRRYTLVKLGSLPGSVLARGFLLFLAAVAASAHAPPTPVPAPPFRVQTNRLVDAEGDAFLLRGAVL